MWERNGHQRANERLAKCRIVGEHQQRAGGVSLRRYCNAESIKPHLQIEVDFPEGPMAFEDRYGLAISTSSDAAAHRYRECIGLMLSAWPGVAQALDAAIEADCDFALAHAARARTHLIYAEMQLAREKAATARQLVARNGSEREKSHVEILALTNEGQPSTALDLTLAQPQH